MIKSKKEILELKTDDLNKLIGQIFIISHTDNSIINGKFIKIKISPADFTLPTDIVIFNENGNVEIGINNIDSIQY